MSEDDSHRDQKQPGELNNNRSNRSATAILRHVCLFVLTVLGFVAVAEFSGVRRQLDHYLNLPTIQTSAVTIAVAAGDLRPTMLESSSGKTSQNSQTRI